MSIKRKRPAVLLLTLIMLLTLAACGGNGDSSEKQDSQGDSSQVASSEEMTDIEDVGYEGMMPVTADQLNNGTYDINVDSSSSMFNIEECSLTVADGKMSAVMTMGGTGYRYIVMKSAEEAAASDEKEYIYPEEDKEGRHTFTVDVESLDKAVKCAAFSDKKEKWYDRTLVFSASSLPLSAFKEGVLTTPAVLGIKDGEYKAEVSLSGGSGRAEVDSPAVIRQSGDSCIAVIRWSSPHYDYMIVDGEKYLPVNEEGNSEFEIPVLFFDRPMPVIADTTAMSEPHEIEYTLLFDSKSMK